ncbi:hypothetical protein [Streptomyces odontomachi]|uniref:hypothetical protein n=1 Tax=Streptomyces odontomachi TaxID=2944940 RepID=UPI00210C0D1E|nr:hypothetical protein [Streptomyces sp. ODS25]
MRKARAGTAVRAALATFGAAALTFTTLAVGSPASATGTAGVVTANDAYLRTYAQSWMIGTLLKGDHFDVQGEQSGYYWGYAQGDFNGCAWIVASSVDKGTSASSAPDCGAPQRIALPDSAHAPADGYDTNGDGTPDRLTLEYKVTCQSAGMYGNYRGGHHLTHRVDLPVNTPVGWRWTTSDGQSAVVRWDAGDLWAYIPRDCVGPR